MGLSVDVVRGLAFVVEPESYHDVGVTLDVVIERCAGIDIGKKLIVAAVRPLGAGRTGEVRSFGGSPGTWRRWLIGWKLRALRMWRWKQPVCTGNGVACVGGTQFRVDACQPDPGSARFRAVRLSDRRPMDRAAVGMRVAER